MYDAPTPDDAALDWRLIHELCVISQIIGRYLFRHIDPEDRPPVPLTIEEEVAIAERMATAAAGICARVARRATQGRG